jgi:hypothetical protein
MPALGSQHDAAVAEQAIGAGDHAGLTYAVKVLTNQGLCLRILTESDA